MKAFPGFLTFRAKMLALVFATTALSVGLLAGFFLKLYERDRMATLFESEQANVRRNASAIENLASLAALADLDQVRGARELILAVDQPCSNAPRAVVSTRYAPQLAELELGPRQWTNSLDAYKLCQALRAAPPAAARVDLLPVPVQLMSPYLPLMLTHGAHSRLVLLSMEDLAASPGSTSFLVDRGGRILWGSDSSEFLARALEDTGLRAAELGRLAARAVDAREPRTQEVGTDGILTAQAVGRGIGAEWALLTLSYKPMLLLPIQFAFHQFVLLSAGLACLVLLIGRFLAGLVVRPLLELARQAARLGAGDFEVRLEPRGHDEIATVQRAFNAMVESVSGLLREKQRAAALENELELAKKVQSLLMPPATVRLPKANLFSFAESAAQCGGDWWGYLEPRFAESDLSILLIGDATDHGVSSALITGVVRGGVSVLAGMIEQRPSLAHDPAALLTHLSRAIHDAARGAISMTFLCVTLDHRNRKLHCANAGHNPGYLIPPAAAGSPSRVLPVGRPGIPLGGAPDLTYDEVETQEWAPGAKLLLYTDGLIDVMDGDRNRFDRKRLSKLVRANAGEKAPVLLNRILEARRDVARDLPRLDDLTVVVCDGLA